MAITFPYDLLTEFPGWSTDFDLLWRQEQSRTAGGQTFVKDMGTPIWQATYQSKPMMPNELDRWRAKFKALENGLNQFRAWPKSRCYPIAYPKGNFWPGDSFDNLLVNPGFESGLTGWTTGAGISASAAFPRTGINSLILDKGAASGGTARTTFQTVNVVPGKQYRLSAWIGGGGASSTAGFYLKTAYFNASNAQIGGFANTVNNVGFGTAYSQVSGLTIAPAGAVTMRFYINYDVTGTAQSVAVDDVSFARYETFTGSGQVNSINANRKAISLKGLSSGYTGKIGDYIQIGTRNLHQVMEDFTANASGVTGEFEIRSHLWPETLVNDAAALVRPACYMTIVPGSLTTTAALNTGRGSISFQGIESR